MRLIASLIRCINEALDLIGLDARAMPNSSEYICLHVIEFDCMRDCMPNSSEYICLHVIEFDCMRDCVR